MKTSPNPSQIILNNSECGKLAQRLDWAKHTLGPMETWPRALRIPVSLMLDSRFPMFISWGPERVFLYNDAYAPFLGEKHPQAFGRTFYENWSEIWNDISPLVERVDRGESLYYEDLKLFMHRHRFGELEETYFTFSYSPIRDEEGNVSGLYCAVVETTEKVFRRRELEASEARHAFSLESAQMGVWRVDLNTNKVTLSKEARTIFGFDRDYDSQNQAIEKCLHPEDRQRVANAFSAAVRSRDLYKAEYRIVRPTGEVRWIQARGQARYDERGNAIAITGTVIDVTNEVNARDRLHEQEAQFRTMANTMPQLAWMADPDGHIFWYNQRWYDYTGTDLAEMQGWGWKKVHHPDHINRVVKKVAAFWAGDWKTNEVWEDTFPLRGADGNYRWFLSRQHPIKDEKGNVIRWFGTNTDVTEQMALQEELRGTVRARDEFLSIASHELKTPLTSLKLQAQLHQRAISRNDPTAYAPERVDTIIYQTDKQVSRLTRLVDDMLDVSRIRSGRLKIERERFDLCGLVDEVVERMRTQFTDASYAVPEVIKSDRAVGDWDRLRLDQVITNLLTNAIRYGDKKPVKIFIATDANNVRLTVQDKGIGISADLKEKIFERFERAVNANEVSGLGLGLFITKQIINAHEGRVWVENKPREGSRFVVELPKRKTD